MKRILCLLLCVALLGGCTASPAETTAPIGTTAAPETQAPTTEAAEPQGDIAILYTNDIHTYIDKPLSYDVIAAVKALYEDRESIPNMRITQGRTLPMRHFHAFLEPYANEEK